MWISKRSLMHSIAIIVLPSMIGGWVHRQPRGVSVTYQVSSPVTQHEPIIVSVVFQNGLDETVDIKLGRAQKEGFRFLIVEPTGTRVDLPPLLQQGLASSGEISLRPNRRYSLRLILDEWYEARAPGDYLINVQLVTPITTAAGKAVDVNKAALLPLKVLPRNEVTLKQKCEQLMLQLQQSKEFPRRSAIAEVLSYIDDPVAIPYLARLVDEREDIYSIRGLMRIGTDEAAEAMIHATESEDRESAAYARSLLHQMLPKITDPRIREKVIAVIK